MTATRQIVLGVGLMAAAFIAMAVGAIVGSHEWVVGELLLFVLPGTVSFCGALAAVIGLARRPASRSTSGRIRRVIGVIALAGIAVGWGFPTLSTLSQVPDQAAGLNGAYLPLPLLTVFLFPAVGLLVGLGFGILIALIW